MMTKKSPIFIFGSGRSGTSLIREVLNRHPNLYVIPRESCFLEWVGEIWKKQKDPTSIALEIHSKLNDLKIFLKKPNSKILIEKIGTNPSIAQIIDFLINLNLEPHHSRWVEKSPLHVWYLDILYKLFPEGKFIHCIRDGRDVIASMKNWGMQPSGWGLLGDAALWKYSINQGLYLSKNIPQQSILHLHYEDFVSNPNKGIEQLFSFIEEEIVEEVFTLKYRNSSHFGCNKTSPITAESVGAWKKVLNPSETELLLYVIEAELKKLGYLPKNRHDFDLSLKQKIQANTICRLQIMKRTFKRLIIKSHYLTI